MLWPRQPRRAAWLLSLCLLMQGHLQVAAAPLSLGGEEEEPPPGRAFPKAPSVPANEIQVHSLLETGPDPAAQKDGGDVDLFQDVDPRALAAILLQALQPASKRPNEQRPSPKSSANEERVQSEAKSSEVQPEGEEEGWEAGKGGSRPREEREDGGPEESNLDQQEMETLHSMLQELRRYSPAAKREEPSQGRPAGPPGSPHSDVLQELEEYEQLKVNAKRTAPAASEPWAGARKLRQQQHLEHQLLQRRYEELAESRRQAEEARRAAAEEERLADMASDLLLQYLLKDGESEEEGRQGPRAQQASEEEGAKGSSLLFEDEESNVAEDKRSNEAPEEEEEDDDDIDPGTIDRLIELSSKLHLPADDVIDILNDVEKKEEGGEEGVAEPSGRSKKPAAPPRHKPQKAPPRATAPQGPRPLPKAYYPPAHQPYRHLPKQNEASWNEVLKGNEYPAPKWYRAKPSGGGGGGGKISNHINPRTFQPPVYHHYRHLPGPMVPRDDYYDASQDRDEELENYIESVLMKHPKAFQ